MQKLSTLEWIRIIFSPPEHSPRQEELRKKKALPEKTHIKTVVQEELSHQAQPSLKKPESTVERPSRTTLRQKMIAYEMLSAPISIRKGKY